MIPSLRKSTFQLVLLTCIICVVQSRPASLEEGPPCPDGYTSFQRDCVPNRAVKEFRLAVCKFKSHLRHSTLRWLNSVCPHTENDEKKRFWGNEGYLSEDRDIEEAKRAWWHSGIKPDRR